MSRLADAIGPELPAPPGWPDPPAVAAYQGTAGRVIEAIAPHTEADPVAILAQLLVAVGAQVGRGAYVAIEATRHHPNEYVVLVGDSAKARKGSSWDHVARLMDRVDPTFAARTSTGLSSGEGLIWALRDPNGADPGAKDPRLLVVEPEFAMVLKATGRDINTLSPVLRSAWDARPLALLTRTAPARASTPHLAVIGHITTAELVHHATSLEIANGLLNRFIFVACRRVRLLPEGGHPDPLAATDIPATLAARLAHTRNRGPMAFSPQARQAWPAIYAAMAECHPGLIGGLLARAEAHVVRLSLLYALTDGAVAIDVEHLDAALALWDYSTRSVAMIFGTASSNPLAEQVHAALVASAGLTRTDIRDLFNRNRPQTAIDAALAELARAGRAHPARVPTGGRPAQLWHATTTPPTSQPA
jgi:hypothetical protein